MSRCPYCNKILEKEDEIRSGWHARCIKKFFDGSILPTIEFDENTIKNIAYNYVDGGYSVTGVQKKLSLHLKREKSKYRLTIVEYPSGYILKPQTKDYPHIAKLEHLTMKLAELIGITTVPNALIKLKDSSIAYITKRIDRTKDGDKIHMEDFCQLSNQLTEDKYHSSYEKCMNIISLYSTQPMMDKTELLYRLLFCFITGNSDMHLKNFSLIECKDGFKLSPAYDLLPVNLILPSDKEETALTIGGKKKGITKKSFINLALVNDIDEKVAFNLISKIINSKNKIIETINNYDLDEDIKKSYVDLVSSRIERLK